MTDRIEQLIDIYPAIWPAKSIRVRPGDLDRFAPSGRGSLSLLPGGGEAVDGQGPDPFLSAPLTEPVGGTIYFHDKPRDDDLAALLRLLRISGGATDYAAFLQRAADPLAQRYVTQLRVVSCAALVGLFGALTLDEMRFFPQQRLTIAELLPAFVDSERAAWDIEQEAALRIRWPEGGTGPGLGFGVMVENAHFGVIRIFSRLWNRADRAEA